jgi:hypothetical protein
MNKTADKTLEKPNQSPARPLAVLAAKPLNEAFKKQGFASREIVTRWPLPTSTTCCGCGPGLAITHAGATCMPARKRLRANTAESFLTPKRSLPNFRALGLTRRRRLPRLHSTARHRRSMATSSA